MSRRPPELSASCGDRDAIGSATAHLNRLDRIHKLTCDDGFMKQEISLPRIANQVTTEAEAYLYLERMRWADAVVCPHCR